MSDTEVVVIGAGPNGLSVAAHLDGCGVERRVFGRTMGAWRFNMPAGMILKSEPYASDLSAPAEGFSARDYCRAAAEPYHERVIPLSKDQFVSYGSWFARNLVPDVEETDIVSLAKAATGFEIRTAEGETLSAARVVVATGIIPFAHVPAELEPFRTDLVSHSSEHADLAPLAGRAVMVLGGGQSALETAALLHEQGSDVKLVRRSNWILWPVANPVSPGRAERLRRPVARLCEGWPCWAYDRFPDGFRSLPERQRVARGLGFLGPAGSWWLKDRVEGRIPMLLGHRIVDVQRRGERLRVRLAGPDGIVEEEVDHIVAGTGYRFDLRRLTYLDAGLRDRLRLVAGAPLVSRGFESSIEGLYFTGALAAPSLGPLMRFVAGTHFVGPRIATRMSSTRRRRNVAAGKPSIAAVTR